jgi:hypothetical protein
MKQLASAIASRLEKAALDNGFDFELGRTDNWLGFASTQCALKVWLTVDTNASLLAAFSQENVVRGLGGYGTLSLQAPPASAVGARTVDDVPSLHRLLRRAFQLGKSLPDQLLHTFLEQTASLPRSTEAERLVVQRVGQEVYRDGLIDFWEGRCAITGLAIASLLRASHIKPWADCPSDAERLDIYNGLLLAPTLDAAFDRGFITVGDDGGVVVSDALDETSRMILGLEKPLRVRRVEDAHRRYLPWHREHVFRRVE